MDSRYSRRRDSLRRDNRERGGRRALPGSWPAVYCFALILAAFGAFAVHADAWYGADWTLRQEVTVDAALSAVNLQDFPLLVSIEDSANPLFAGARSDGRDIVFTDADGTSKLAHEIELYDPATGVLKAWVRVPTLQAGGTTLYMYYGNSSVSNQEAGTEVWDDGYKLAMHLNEEVTNGEIGGVHYDSTVNGHVGTQYRNEYVADGRIDGGQLFTRPAGGTTDDPETIEIGNLFSDDWTAITVEAWIRRTATNDARIVAKAFGTGTLDAVFMLGMNGSNLRVRMGTDVGNSAEDFDILPAFTDAGSEPWIHVAFTWDSADETIRAYLNGVQQATASRTGSTMRNTSDAPQEPGVFIGNFTAEAGEANRVFPGRIDEVRLSRVARSGDQLIAGVRNQENPATYLSFEEQVHVAGSVRRSEVAGGIGAGYVVRAAVNGDAGYTSTAVTDAAGAYSIAIPTGQIESGDRIIAFLDGGAENGSTVTIGDGNNLTGFDIIRNYLTLRSETGAPIANTDLVAARYSSPDVLYTVAGEEITVSDGTTLWLPAGYALAQSAAVTVGTTAGRLRAGGTWQSGANDLTVAGNVEGSGLLSGGSAAVEIGGNFTVSNYTATSAVTAVAGSWSVGNFTHSNGTVRFTDTGSVGSEEFWNLELAGTAGVVRTALGALTVENGLTLSAGTFEPGASTHSVAGTWNDTAISFEPADGTIALTGAGVDIISDEAGGNAFANLRIENGATLGSDVRARGTVRLAGGTLSAGANTVYLEGDWNNSVGNTGFDAGTGAVVLENPATESRILGATTFGNLQVPAAAAGKTVRFAAGRTQRVTGVLSAAGTTSAYIQLLSTSEGGVWSIDVDSPASSSVERAVVQDSTAVNELEASSSFDAGNNTGWNFTTATDTWTWVGLHSERYDGGTNPGRNWYAGGTFAPAGEASGPGPSTATYIPETVSQELVDAYNDQFSTSVTPGDRNPVPLIDSDTDHESVTVGTGAVLDTAGFSIQATGSLSNRGTILRTTEGSVSAGGSAGRVLYYDNPLAAALENTAYFDLHLAAGAGSVGYSLSADLTVNGGLVLDEAVLYPGSTGERSYTGTAVLDSGANVLSLTGDTRIGAGSELRAGTAAGTGFTAEGDVSGGGTLSWQSTNVDVSGALGVATLSAPTAARVLRVGGDWLVGAFTPNGDATVEFSGPGSVSAATFHDLSLSVDSGTRTAAGNITVQGDLAIAAGAVLDLGVYDLTVLGNISGDGTLRADSGSVTVGGNMAVAAYEATSAVTQVSGDWSVSTFDAAGGQVRFAGTSTLAGPEAFHDLRISPAASLDTAGHAVSIAGSFENAGLLVRRGGDYVGRTDATQGTVEYRGAGGSMQVYPGSDYHNLTVNDDVSLAVDGATPAFEFGGDVEIGGNFRLERGRIAAGNRRIRIAGDWDKAVTDTLFTRETSTVELYDAAQVSTYSGRTVFYRFEVRTPGKEVAFTPADSLDTSDHRIRVSSAFVIEGSGAEPVVLRSATPGDTWNLSVIGARQVSLVDVTDSNGNGLDGESAFGIQALTSIDGGNNANWTFPGTIYRWTGATSSDWGVTSNWELPDGSEPATAPGANDSVIVLPATNDPLLGVNRTLQALTIESGGELDIEANTLTVSGPYENAGVLRRHLQTNASDIAVNRTDTDSGTVEYYAGTGFIQDYGGLDYHNLIIGVDVTLGYTLAITGELDIETAVTLSADGKGVAVGGNWTNNGAFTAGGNTVSFVDSSRQSVISGDTTFANVVVAAAGKQLQFQSGSEQTVGGTFTVAGTAGDYIMLESATAGASWNIVVTPGSEDVRYAQITDSVANPSTTNDLAADDSVDGGGNTNWTFGPSVLFRTWQGGTVGAETDWDTASNWDGDILPTSESQVTIPGTAVDMPVLGSPVSVATLTIEASASVDTAGFDLAISEELSNAGTLYRRGGDFVGRTDPGAGTVVYQGTGGSIQRYPGEAFDYHDLVLDTVSYSISGHLRVAGDLTGSGELAGGTVPVSIGGAMGIASYSATADTTAVGGDWSVGSFANNGGTVRLEGTGVLAGGVFRNLVIAGGTRTLTADIEVQSNVTIEPGAVLAGSIYTIGLSGDWVNEAGGSGFAAGSSTVRLDNSGGITTISGNTGFSRLRVQTPGKTVRFAAGSRQSVSEEFTVEGADGDPVHLLSTSAGTPWEINVSSGALSGIEYAEVRDSDASSGRTLEAAESEDLGNSINWVFVQVSANVTWTAGAGTSDWHDPNNWNPAVVPDATLSARVPSGLAIYPEVGGLTDAEARSLEIEGGASVTLVDSRALAVAETLLVSGSLDAAAGGNITVSGNVDFGSAGGYVKGGAEFVFDGGTTQLLTGNGNDLGDTRLTGTGTTLVLQDTVAVDSLVVGAGAELDLGANRTVRPSGDWTNDGQFTSRSGTVTFEDGLVQLIQSGGDSFYNLTAEKSGSGELRLLDSLVVTGNLSVDAALDQTTHNVPVTVNGTASIDAGASPIDLTVATNSFQGTVTLAASLGAAVDIRNSGGIEFAGVTAGGGGAVTIIAEGAVTHTGSLSGSALDVTTLDAGGAAIVLDTVANSFSGGVRLRTRNADDTGDVAAPVGYADAGGFEVLGIASGAAVRLSADGVVIQGAGVANAIDATTLELVGAGSYQLDNTDNAAAVIGANTAGGIDYAQGGALEIGTAGATNGLSAGADIRLAAGGALTQSRPISGAGLELTGTGPYTLNDAGNTVSSLAAAPSAAGAGLSYRDAGGFTVNTVGVTSGVTTTGGDVTLYSAGGALGVGGPIDSGTGLIDLDGGGTVELGANLTTDDGNITVGATGGVSLTAGVSVTTGGVGVAGDITVVSELQGAQTLDLTSGDGAIDLQQAVGTANAVTSLTVNSAATARFGADVTTANGQSITAGTIQTNGTHTTAGSPVNFGGAVELQANTTINSNGGNVDLTGAVDAATVDVQGLEVSAGAGAITIGGLIGDVQRLAYLRLDTTDHGFDMPQLSVNGDLELFTGGAVTQNGAIDGTTLHVKTRAAAAANITLENANNDFDSVVLETRDAADAADAAGSIGYRDAGGFALGNVGNAGAGIRTTADTTLQAGAAVTQSGELVSGELLLLGAGPYTLDTNTNDITTLAANLSGAGNNLTYHDANDFGVGTVNATSGITTADGDVTLESAGGTLGVGGPIDSGTGLIDLDGGGTVELGANLTTDGGNITVGASGGASLTAGVSVTTGGVGVAGDIVFTGALDGAQNLTLTAGTGAITFQGAVGAVTPLGSGTGAALTILSAGTPQPLTFAGSLETQSGIDSAVAVRFEGDVLLGAGDTPTNFDAAVELLDGFTITSENNVSFGTDLTDELIIGAGSTVDVADHSFSVGTLVNGGRFRFHGTQAVADQVFAALDITSGVIEYYGPGNIVLEYSEFYTLEIAKGGGASAILGTATTVNGDLILSSGSLDVGAGNNGLTVGGNWDSSGGGTFVPGTAEVSFVPAAATIAIWGDNEFHDFTLDAPGVTVEFEKLATQTVTGVWYVRGATGNLVALTAEGEAVNNEPPPPPDYPTLEIPAADQWIVDLQGDLDFDYVEVGWSFAETVIVVPPTRAFDPTDGRDIDLYLTVSRWIREFYVEASTTWDLDRSGKIDRIRVEMPAEMAASAPFAGFTVEVEGYEVIGYELGDDHSGPLDMSVFFILLAEGASLDTAARPRWRIVNNTSLRDDTTGSRFVTVPSGVPYVEEENGIRWVVPDDGAAPLVGYTLALGGRNEVFVNFSEPLETGAAVVNVPDPGFTVTGFAPAPGGLADREYLVSLGSDMSEAGILNQLVLEFSGIVDQFADAPNALRSRETYDDGGPEADPRQHRVSDVVLGRDGNAPVTPVFVTDEAVRGDDLSGISLVRVFDGTGGYVQPQNLRLQASLSSETVGAVATLGRPGDPRMQYDANVGGALRANSFWLPPYDEREFSGLVPGPNPGVTDVGVSSTLNALREYAIPASNPAIEPGNLIEFFFRIGPEPAAAGDSPNGAPAAAEPEQALYFARISDPESTTWYRNVRPWAFEIDEVLEGRGSVSIMNNIIDPSQGDTTRVRYELDEAGMVTVNVFNLAGDLIDVLHRGRQQPAEYQFSWDGRNRRGSIVARGLYFIRVVGPGFDEYRNVMVVR